MDIEDIDNNAIDILLVGSGGREHALAYKLRQSPRCGSLYCAPGNPGIAELADCIDIYADEIEKLAAFAIEKNIRLVVIGPEKPLVLGFADRLQAAGIPVFGPTQKAAQLEGSKSFMKDLCRRYDIPTAAYETFAEIEPALSYIESRGAPIVVKADGLAAGKGVIVAQTIEEAKTAVQNILGDRSFGDAGASIVIEEFLDGEEISFFAICDGDHVLALTSAQDHKRAFDGDTGPNTGGMGAYSPARLMTPELKDRIMDKIIHPAMDGMKADGVPFAGILFAGLMIADGEAKLLEFNARFGDPEMQAIMLRLDADLVNVLEAASTGNLHLLSITWSDEPAIAIVMAANGYPDAPEKGSIIRGIEDAAKMDNVRIFHAGTEKRDGEIIAVGGRVLNICAFGKNFLQAREAAYAAAEKIAWPEGFYRRDIGWRALEMTEKK